MIEDPPFLVTAFANRLSKPSPKAAENPTTHQATRPHRAIGPLGTAVRLLVGLLLVGLIVYGQLATSGHLAPVTWVLGLIGFPALVLAWHVWRIRRKPAGFSDTSPLSFVLSLALPLAFYLTGWYVRALWFKSSATLILVGSSLVLAALRGSAGCEFLALSGLAPAPSRPDGLCCLYASGRLGTLSELYPSLKEPALFQPITIPLRKVRGAR